MKMKWINKGVCRLFALILAVMLVLPGYIAASAETTSDETPSASQQMADVLKLLPRYEDGSYGGSDAVSRGELAAAAAAYMKYQPQKQKTYFMDVSADSPHFSQIHFLADLGIVSKEEQLFRPEDRATVGEAMKILLSVLGYDRAAVTEGGYPLGYIRIGAKLGLTDALSGRETERYITRRELSELFFLGMDCETLLVWDGGDTHLMTAEGTTFGQRYYGWQKISGLVERTRITGLFDAEPGRENELMVNGKTIAYSGEEDWLGYEITAYCGEKEGRLYLICADTSENRTVTLTDLENPVLSGEEIRYVQSGQERILRLEKNCIPIYNRTLQEEGDLILPKDGTITLIDNNGNGRYDVLKTMDYISGVVTGITETGVGLRDSERILTERENRVVFGLEKVSPGMVVSVAESKNFVGFYVSEERISGEIELRRVEDGRTVLKVGGREVFLAPNCKGKYNLGQKVTVLLNITGKAIYIEGENETANFCYLIDCKRQENMDKGLIFLYFNGSTVESAEGASRIRIDGKSYRESEIGVNAGESGTKILLAVDQLVILEKNKAGEITGIDTGEQGESGADDKLQCTARGKMIYKTSSGNFEGKAFIGNNSKIFSIPEEREDHQGYSMYDMDDLRNDETYDVSAFRTDSEKLLSEAVVLIRRPGDGAINNETGLAVITEQVTEMDADGILRQKLSMLFDGNMVSLFVDEKLDVSGLQVGDTIRYGVDKENRISQYEMIYDRKNGMRENPIGSFISNFGVTSGVVRQKSNDIIAVQNPLLPEENTLHLASRHRIYVVAFTGREVTVRMGTMEDILDEKTAGTDASIAVVHSRFGDPKSIVVYNR